MIYYKYRWVCGFLLFLFSSLAGFYLFIAEDQQKLQRLSSQALKLTQQLATMYQVNQQKPSTQVTYHYQYADALEMVFLSAYSAQASLQRISLQGQFADLDTIQLRANGSFKQLKDFLVQLQHQPILIVVTDLSWCVLHAETLELKLTMNMFKDVPARVVALNTDAFAQSPFCNRKQFYAEETTQMPLESLQMVGYLQKDKRSEAWFRLPNNTLMSVKVADRIGSERGVVTQVTPEQVVIATRTGNYIIRNGR